MTCWTIRGFKPGTKSHKTLNFNLWRGRIYLICVLLLLFISGSISRIWHVGPSVVLNRALKVGMIRTRVSPASWGITTAGWWNQCFVQSWHQSVATSLYEGRVEGGTRCSKIFTARTDSIFSQLNGRGLDEGGFDMWHVLVPAETCHCWSPPSKPNQTSQPVPLCGHSIHSISPRLSALASLYQSEIFWWCIMMIYIWGISVSYYIEAPLSSIWLSFIM